MMPGLCTGMRVRISDIFWSVQGEGLNSGMPSIFLRLAGCSEHCPYCDTKESWETGKEMPADKLIFAVDQFKREYPDSMVVITGGEPLEQDLRILVFGLNKKGYKIAIETNGLHFQDLAIDWWTVSPKENNHYFIHEKLRPRLNEIKLVVTPSLTLDVIQKIRRVRDDLPIFLQPDFFDQYKYQSTFSLFQQCQQQGIPHLRLGLQLHKVYTIK